MKPTQCPWCQRPLFVPSPVGCDHYPAMERAAIREHDGKQDRVTAEREAAKEVKP